MIGIQSEVMPFVRFETKDYGRNENASLAAGRHIPLRANFIFIHAHGSKDSREFLADEWLPRKRAEASRSAYNGEWVKHFENQYEEWKKGNELPRQGTPILTWSVLNNEQNVRVRALGYQVVEDVAAIPDGSLGELGLDGRVIRDAARAWIQEGKDKGVNARLIGELTAKNEDLQRTIEQMQSALNELKAQIGEKRGRKEAA